MFQIYKFVISFLFISNLESYQQYAMILYGELRNLLKITLSVENLPNQTASLREECILPIPKQKNIHSIGTTAWRDFLSAL